MSSIASVGAAVEELQPDAGGTVALASAGARLRAERDSAIRGAHGDGVPVASIARMMKMSVQRVSQIVGDAARL
jgi:hypothetical protein